MHLDVPGISSKPEVRPEVFLISEPRRIRPQAVLPTKPARIVSSSSGSGFASDVEMLDDESG